MKKNLKKTLWLFLWIVFNCLKAGVTLRSQFKSPEIPGTHFIDLGRMKG